MEAVPIFSSLMAPQYSISALVTVFRVGPFNLEVSCFRISILFVCLLSPCIILMNIQFCLFEQKREKRVDC